MSLDPFNPPWCIAHRGFSSDFPENTFAAFDAALAAPIQGIETDLQLSADEVPVVYHNRSLKLVGGGLHRVRSRSLDQLRDLDYGSWKDARFQGQSLPLLEDLLTRYGKRTQWLLEIKLREASGNRTRLEQLASATLDAIERHDLADQVFILCFDLDLLLFAHRYNPHFRYVWNQDWPGHTDERADFLYAYSLQHRAVNRELVARIHQKGQRVFTFTVDTLPTLRRVLGAGVDAVMSNNPIWLADQLGLTG